MQSIRRQLIQARKQRNWTLQILSEATGISVSYLHQMETGVKQRPLEQVLARLCAVLDLDYDLCCWQSDCWPSDLRDAHKLYPKVTAEKLQQAFAAFRDILARP
jgi:transcriptional regulator with XRE-family HTH domain